MLRKSSMPWAWDAAIPKLHGTPVLGSMLSCLLRIVPDVTGYYWEEPASVRVANLWLLCQIAACCVELKQKYQTCGLWARKECHLQSPVNWGRWATEYSHQPKTKDKVYVKAAAIPGLDQSLGVKHPLPQPSSNIKYFKHPDSASSLLLFSGCYFKCCLWDFRRKFPCWFSTDIYQIQNAVSDL